MASSRARRPNACRGSPINWTRRRSKLFSANGYDDCLALHRRRPEGWIPVRSFDPSSGVLADDGPRPPDNGSGVFRGSHPREPRYRATRQCAIDLQSPRQPADARSVSDASDHRRRDPIVARGLQESHIKEYFKEGRALRVETTINDTRDFRIGRRLTNLPQLREIGFAANRRLLDVQRVSHDCAVGEDTWESVVRPITVGEQRASALRFDDPRVQAFLLVGLGSVRLSYRRVSEL